MGKENLRNVVYGASGLATKYGLRAGSAGCLVSGNDGYLGKVYDGVKAVPEFVCSLPDTYRDLINVEKLGDGLEKIVSRVPVEKASGFMEHVSTMAGDLGRKMDGVAEIYDVVRDVDCSGIMGSIYNLANNVRNNPIETGAAVATVLGLSYIVPEVLTTIRTRGKGTFLENSKLNLREYVWDKVPETIKKIL